MGEINYTVPTVGQDDSTEEPLIPAALTAIKTLLNGNIDEENISPSMTFPAGQLSGLSSGKLLVGNASNIAEARTLSGDVTVNNTGAVTIADDAVSSNKLNITSLNGTNDSDVNNIAFNVITSTGCAVNVTTTGSYLVFARGYMEIVGQSSLPVIVNAYLLQTLTTRGTWNDGRLCAVNAPLRFSFVLIDFRTYTAGDVISTAVKHNHASGHGTVYAGACKIDAFRIG
jgi:hypothetical protein